MRIDDRLTDVLVSIIVPIYNAKPFLNECVDSLLRQTHSKIEVILVNDGSTDGSDKLCIDYKNMDSRVVYISQNNSGVSAARNIGISKSNGEYILFVDADDYVMPTFVEELLDSTKMQEADCVQCGYIKKKGETVADVLRGKSFNIIGNQIVEGLLKSQGYGRTWCMLYKKAIIGNERFNETLSMGEDAEFNLRVLARSTKLYYLNKPLYIYRVNENSAVRRYDPHYCDKYIKTSKAILEHCKGNNTHYQMVQEFICYIIVQIVVNFSCNKVKGETVKKQIQSVKNVCNINIFKYALKNVQLSRDSISFYLLITLLRYKQYWIVVLLCALNKR